MMTVGVQTPAAIQDRRRDQSYIGDHLMHDTRKSVACADGVT